MTNAVTIKTETVYEDGNFNALISVYGAEFAISYSTELKVWSTTGASSYDRRPRWQKNSTAKIARQWAQDRIAAQSPSWHAAHEALYAEEAG